MTDHANELRRYSRKIGHPAGDVPSVMLAAAEEIERLAARLKASEKERDDVAQQLVQSERGKRAISEECDALRTALRHEADCVEAAKAKIEAMERQKPVAWARKLGLDVPSFGCVTDLKYRPSNIPESSYIPLYLAPGAQPAPIEQDTSVRKAWARFSNELHRSPHAPYPGMSEAFEQHFSQSFTDREWRAESATWAAAWKAAKRHEAQAQPAPIIPEGWKLVPLEVIELYSFMCAAFVPMTPQQEEIALQLDLAKRAMLAATPEAKP